MPKQPILDEEQLDRQLAELDQNPAAPVDSTFRELHAELETLAVALRQPAEADPYQTEAACLRAVAQAQALAGQLAKGTIAPSDSHGEELDLAEGTMIGSYRVISRLGQGGMGAVFLAHDSQLDRQVALKVMLPSSAANPAASERFLREARLAARIEHDHIVPIYQVGQHEGVPFLAMPVLKGRSLQDLLERDRVTIAQALNLGKQIAEGLAAAHQRGLIHRDIKPSNIWVEPSGGRTKIFDFGLARLEQDDTHLTNLGTILGTPAYMSPEQARGKKVDARTDLWSLGVILYQMTTGTHPFTGPTTMAMLTSIAVDQPRPLAQVNPNVPHELSDLVMRLLEKDPAQRTGSAGEVAAALAEILRRTTELETPKSEVDLERLPAILSTQTITWSGVDASSAPSIFKSGVGILPANPSLQESQAGSLRHLLVNPKYKSGRSTSPTLSRTSGRGRFVFNVAAAVLLALMPVAYFFGGTIIRIATNQGELVVEIDDPNVQIKVVQNGVVVQDSTSKREFTLTVGKGEIEVFEKDGIKLTTKEFALTRGEKATVRVTLQELADARQPTPAPPAKDADPDRRAAEYALSIGGVIRINDQDRDISTAELPEDPFRLTYANFNENKEVNDAGLVHFQDCKNLTELRMNNTQVTDVGAAHFKDCSNLKALSLKGTQVTDAGMTFFKDCKKVTDLRLEVAQVTDIGLAHFKDCKNLEQLYLYGTRVTDAGMAFFKDCKFLKVLSLPSRVTDAGLAHFRDCKNLTTLLLNGTQVTDAGLVHFQDCRNLTKLDLSGRPVTDAGLTHFRDCKKLTSISLIHTRMTDAGLAHFQDCMEFVSLYLNDTQVTDAGLAHFQDCKNLGALWMRNTRVTDLSLSWIGAQMGAHDFDFTNTRISRRGYEELKAVQPKTRIVWSERNHDLAQAVLKIGGKVEIAAPGEPKVHSVSEADELIRDFFQVRRVSLAGIKQPLDELAKLVAQLRDPEFDRLERLDLSGTNSPNLAFVDGVAGVDELLLADAGLNDVSLGRLPKLPALKRLVLDGNDIHGAGLRHLANTQSQLAELSLNGPSVDAAAALLLSNLKALKRLSLVGANLSDAGIGRLESLTNLEQLDLRQTNVTQDGIARLQKSLPKCQITL